jgi:hypothetical protein
LFEKPRHGRSRHEHKVGIPIGDTAGECGVAFGAPFPGKTLDHHARPLDVAEAAEFFEEAAIVTDVAGFGHFRHRTRGMQNRDAVDFRLLLRPCGER